MSRNKTQLPFQCTDSYDTLQFSNFKLSCCKLADRFCFLKNNTIVMIHHIGIRSGHPVIIGKEYKKYCSYNRYPCDSRDLNIFLVKDCLTDLKYYSVTEIARKAVALPWEGEQMCILPLLHSDVMQGTYYINIQNIHSMKYANNILSMINCRHWMLALIALNVYIVKYFNFTNCNNCYFSDV